MELKSCCFTGHRDIPKEIIPQIKKFLENEIIKLIHQGVVYYKTGGARGFDTIAALTILELKEEFPHIKFILVLPCKEQTRGWNKSDTEIYNWILEQADTVIYTSEYYYDGCMQKRNRRLVKNSGYCICYLIKNSGGTKFTIDYAKENGLKTIMFPLFPN